MVHPCITVLYRSINFTSFHWVLEWNYGSKFITLCIYIAKLLQMVWLNVCVCGFLVRTYVIAKVHKPTYNLADCQFGSVEISGLPQNQGHLILAEQFCSLLSRYSKLAKQLPLSFCLLYQCHHSAETSWWTQQNSKEIIEKPVAVGFPMATWKTSSGLLKGIYHPIWLYGGFLK